MESGQESPESNLEDRKEEKVVESLENVVDFDANREEINGEMVNFSVGEDKRDEEANERIGSPSLEPESIWSPSSSNYEVNSTPVKGYGLKKWRRIRRNLSKDATSGGIDSLLILKRQLSLNEPKKARDGNSLENVIEGNVETIAPSVGSFRCVKAVDGVPFDPELAQLVARGGFSIGMDSDNSEDRSSKSSTATSFPKPRHEIGFGRERTRVKNVGGRGGGHAFQQRCQQGRGTGLDTSKKIQGDRIRLEKENSMSSIESDLRSSNLGFLRWGSRVSNGRHGKKSLDFDGENGDEAQISEDARSGCYKENGTVEELLSEDLEPDLLNEESEKKRRNFCPPSGIDPFVESIVMLQAAQDALETEIQKIGEIGKAAAIEDFDDQSVETEVSSSAATAEPHLLELNRKIEHLRCKLQEASTIARAKESKVTELEDIISRTRSSKNRTGSSDEIELELEAMLKKKIQAEIEYLITSRTAQNWKVLAEDQIALLEAENMLKVRDAEDKAMKLKVKAEELENYCSELMGNGRVLKLKNKVCKFSFCSFIQLLLLGVAVGMFLIQPMTPSDEFVPT